MKLLASVVLVASIAIAGFATPTVFRSPEGFSVAAPVQLVKDGTERLTTDEGKPFTHTFYKGGDKDGDYFVQVSTYPFTVVPEDLQRALTGFATALNGKITDAQNVTVSGQPAVEAIVVSPAITFRYLVTFRGTRLFQFSYSGTGDPKAFFDSVATN